jgi:two-component system, chemotaxis family, protein-glutamate methylesterase/glutaminase
VKKIHVMVIDDSALIRQLLTDLLPQDPQIGSVDSAPDPLFALRKMEKLWPDVIVLDIEMPRMNGIEFSRKIMRERPTPIVILSSKTENNLALGLEALKNGAVELIHKPESGIKDFIETSAHALLDAVKAAAASRPAAPAAPIPPARRNIVKKSGGSVQKTDRIILIGASTGGTSAIEEIFSRIDFPHCPIVIVQHMPAGFTRAFAERLDRSYASNFSEAADGQKLSHNCVYIAPGGLQTEISRRAGEIFLTVSDKPPMNRHKPSVDVLFQSSAMIHDARFLGILLTGMGADGAAGMVEMKRNGALTIAQDAESCVVFGMPAAAIQQGGASRVLALTEIWHEISAFCEL